MTIDWWTLGIQTVNVVILVWLLGRFFWRPVAAMIEQRRVSAQTALADAAAQRDKATAALGDIEQTRAGFAQERDKILAEARETAEQARTALLKTASDEAASLEEAAKAAIETDRAAADKAWDERANGLAVDIAKRLVAEMSGPMVRDNFLDRLLKEIRAMPDPARQAAGTNGAVLDVTSVETLNSADQERYRTLIAAALGANPKFAFKVDPALIAGLELDGPHFKVSNSWRADLDTIHLDLAHGQ